jgi:hypothetical protein
MLKKSSTGNAAQTTAQSTGTSSTPGAVGTPGTSSTPSTVATPAPGQGSLPASPIYEAGAGQLSGFSLFVVKNPFGGTPGSETNATTPTTPTTPTNSTTTTPAVTFAAAEISVNGAAESVELGASFPASSPAFTLDTISAKSIAIRVAGGSFANGQSKVTIRKGQTVVLVNTVDGIRYALKFVKPTTGTEAPSVTPPTTSSFDTTTDTTTTSTSTGP